MASTRRRILELINSGIRTWTVSEVQREIGVSYSTARTHLKALEVAGDIQRVGLSVIGRAPQWGYFRCR